MAAPGKRRKGKHLEQCKRYRAENRREKNRDARAARILSGFRPHVDGMNATDYKRYLSRGHV